MNEWQVLKQLRYLARARTWTGGSEKVFAADSVRITVATEEKALRSLRMPILLIRPGGSQSDPQHDEEPDLIQGEVAMRIFASLESDPVGEAVLVGANRTGGQTSSKGRGLLEVEEELFNAVGVLNDLEGVKIQSRAKSAAAATMVEQFGYVAFRDYLFEVVTSADRFYHAPTRLAATAPGGGAVSLTWSLPPDRYDRLRVILRRAAGSTAPATPSSGTGVSLSGDLATSKTDTPGVGTWSYALFAAYDETRDPPATEERYSAGATRTIVAT